MPFAMSLWTPERCPILAACNGGTNPAGSERFATVFPKQAALQQDDRTGLIRNTMPPAARLSLWHEHVWGLGCRQ